MHDRSQSEQLKDEIYRQMFRVESRRPRAEMNLAIALLHAWIASDCASEGSKDRQWLEKICPICLAMIEAAIEANQTTRQCTQ
jgi:hypothetical protein